MRINPVLVLAILLPLFASCSAHRGWMRTAPFARNQYLVPVPTHNSTVVVAAPSGWRLDPDGGPVHLGSFIHPQHPLSPIVVSTCDDALAAHTTRQADLFARILAEARASEPKRLREHREMIAHWNPALRPKPLPRDPVSARRLMIAPLRDGRQVWISRFYSPSAGFELRAYVPEGGFIATYQQPLEDSPFPSDLLAAFAATVRSYRCEHQ